MRISDTEEEYSDDEFSEYSWESASSERTQLFQLFACSTPPPPFRLPPLDANRPVQQQLPEPKITELKKIPVEQDSSLFFAELARRIKNSSAIPCQRQLPKDILEFAFERYALASPRLQDEVLFLSFELFTYFQLQEPLCYTILLAASLLLASKESNVRHISVNVCLCFCVKPFIYICIFCCLITDLKSLIELGGLPPISRRSIVETETSLFLSLHERLNQPTALSFIRVRNEICLQNTFFLRGNDNALLLFRLISLLLTRCCGELTIWPCTFWR